MLSTTIKKKIFKKFSLYMLSTTLSSPFPWGMEITETGARSHVLFDNLRLVVAVWGVHRVGAYIILCGLPVDCLLCGMFALLFLCWHEF